MTTMYSRTIRVCPSLKYSLLYRTFTNITTNNNVQAGIPPRLKWSEEHRQCTINHRQRQQLTDPCWTTLDQEKERRSWNQGERKNTENRKQTRAWKNWWHGGSVHLMPYILICCLDRRQHHTLLGVFNDKKNHNRVYCMKGYVCFMHRNNNRVKAERKRRPTKVEP